MVLPRPVKAVVFDMDGLLIDTERVFHMAVVAAARDRGLDFPTELFLQMVGLIWADNEVQLRAHFGADFDPTPFREEASRHFHALIDAELTLKDGVVEILDHLDELRLPRAICTSSRREEVNRNMSRFGLSDRFDMIVANGEYPRPKPSPDPYLAAAERLGVEPAHCLALEDSHNGVRAAAAAGMMTIMVPDLLDPTEEMQTLCVRIARDLHEVRELLEAQRA
jgi:HAD superfamily hydrolase (TIGR01509 family)